MKEFYCKINHFCNITGCGTEGRGTKGSNFIFVILRFSLIFNQASARAKPCSTLLHSSFVCWAIIMFMSRAHRKPGFGIAPAVLAACPSWNPLNVVCLISRNRGAMRSPSNSKHWACHTEAIQFGMQDKYALAGFTNERISSGPRTTWQSRTYRRGFTAVV